MITTPMCWKCSAKITEEDECGAFRIVGCKEEAGIQNFADAQRLCPLLGKSGGEKIESPLRVGYEVSLVPPVTDEVRVRRIVSKGTGEIVSCDLLGWTKTFEEAGEMVRKDREARGENGCVSVSKLAVKGRVPAKNRSGRRGNRK